MVIKVQVLDTGVSNSTDIRHGLVVEGIDKKFFNRGRISHVFDVELLSEIIIPNETILKYHTMAVRATETIVGKDKDNNPVEITYDYVFLSELVLEIKQFNNYKEGDA